MVYRRHGRRTKRTVKGDILKKKPTAYNQKNQLARLATQVAGLARRQRKKARFAQYKMSDSFDVTNYAVMDYTLTSSWTEIFQDPVNAAETGSVQLRSLAIDNIVDIGSEGSGVVDFTFFLVRLRASTGRKLLDDTGTDLGALVNGVHYSQVSQRLIHLNKSYFDIKYVKRFSLSNQTAGTSAEVANTTNLASTMKRFYVRTMLNCKIKNGSGNWQLSEGDHPIYSKCYGLLFSNNSGLDLEYPRWETNGVANVKWT